jgi:hypothetical protein
VVVDDLDSEHSHKVIERIGSAALEGGVTRTRSSDTVNDVGARYALIDHPLDRIDFVLKVRVN